MSRNNFQNFIYMCWAKRRLLTTCGPRYGTTRSLDWDVLNIIKAPTARPQCDTNSPWQEGIYTKFSGGKKSGTEDLTFGDVNLTYWIMRKRLLMRRFADRRRYENSFDLWRKIHFPPFRHPIKLFIGYISSDQRIY